MTILFLKKNHVFSKNLVKTGPLEKSYQIVAYYLVEFAKKKSREHKSMLKVDETIIKGNRE